MDLSLLINLNSQVFQMAFATFLGVLVGLRREMFFQSENIKGIMGIRTLPLLSLLGVVSTFFMDTMPYLPIISFFFVFVFIFIAY